MTPTTPDSLPLPAETEDRVPPRWRFALAFAVGLLVALGLGLGAMLWYDAQYAGRVLPGVSVGAVDLSGLTPEAARTSLEAEYAALSDGEIVLNGPDGAIVVPYASLGRRADVDAMVADALAVGRAGNPIERMLADARTAIRGVSLEPRVTFDAQATANRLAALALRLDRVPADASVVVADQGRRFELIAGKAGRTVDAGPAIATAVTTLGTLDAPATLGLDLVTTPVEPATTTVEAFNAKALADRLTGRITLAIEDVDKPEYLSASRLRSWTTFAPTADGGYAPTVDTSDLVDTLERLAKKVDRAPVNASFKTKGGDITGVTPSKEGYTLDIAGTQAAVLGVLEARQAGAVSPTVTPALEVTKPVLTTAQAEAALPKMRKISQWTTYFPVSEKNGQGANIWIPARLINGYVVAPRGTFDFWDAVGPVTRAKGYTDGGAIINGRTEPQGALAGGICSCSTTLFNAALRAGYEMGDRLNHYYYIDRYPLGLDATVFISASGSKQTMSFTNDTDFPILIRGYGWREGGAGYVRFELYSVPNGRKVSFSKPQVWDQSQARDSVQYTSALPPGASKRVEYPVDGKKVSVTRVVRDRDGNVIHKDTYYSHYKTVTGIVQIGRGATTGDSAGSQ
jgi:vancomycin resistance protein YoaR